MSGARGQEMLHLVERLYPICRSITGDGVRETLDVIGEVLGKGPGEGLELARSEVPTGTPVLDWTVPREWNVRDAWIKDLRGRRVVDFRASNLHLVSYSTPVAPRRIALDELRSHLYALPDHPDWIPYRTSYYDESWGFCVTQKQLDGLVDPEYEVCIDSTLADGALSYGECLLPGDSEREVLISVHVCHPSLCNDNLSGIAVATTLARALSSRRRRLSYRFVFAPGTIGAITWLARNRDGIHRVAHGLTLVCLGDERPLSYKRTLRGDADIDRAVEQVLAASGDPYEVKDFHPYGYDERQYNSPGFRLPVGSLMRGRHGEFPEYHSSGDDLAFVRGDRLEGAVETLLAVCERLEGNRRYRNLSPEGEPQLGRRGLYRAIGGETDPGELSMAMLWLLQLADGERDLLAVAERSGVAWGSLARAAELLVDHGLLADETNAD